ncbi:Tripartite tricarboxylate transporter substrate binding protein [Hyphomicrobiales bacterium]|nr:Tripartite tricarboxylate transporter substrate binding protein [Hyphomicrobiales bacterium]CAH1694735.1 Tripartite tricarboxylate transporter substrate binding protein [Hyphomicrobiales bacterium]
MDFKATKRLLLSAMVMLPCSIAANWSPAQASTCPQGFPSKPIRFVVGFGAGGGTDLIARSIASAIEKQQKWTIVVENKPGANGGAMAVWLKSQPADGYVVGILGTDAIAINPAQNNTGYTWQDFEYLGSGMQTWLGLVALSDRPYSDLAGLIAYAKEKGRATVAVAGINQEVLVRQLAQEYNVSLVPIPGAGAAEAMTSALGGHVDATTQGTLHVAQIKSGKMKQLASIIDRRVPYAPDSPTLAEQGSKAEPLNSHTTLITPRGLPEAVKSCLKQALDDAIRTPEYKAQMDKFENEPLNLGEQGNRDLNARLADFYMKVLAKN